jgi:hypothetical protein
MKKAALVTRQGEQHTNAKLNDKKGQGNQDRELRREDAHGAGAQVQSLTRRHLICGDPALMETHLAPSVRPVGLRLLALPERCKSDGFSLIKN